jgi:erythromycin esterase
MRREKAKAESGIWKEKTSRRVSRLLEFTLQHVFYSTARKPRALQMPLFPLSSVLFPILSLFAMSLFAADPALDEFLIREAVPFLLADSSFDPAVERVVASLGAEVTLLGFGEALHGGEEILRLRNRLFQRLVEKHGYSAIALESSFPRARIVNDYIHGRGPASFDELKEIGFGHGMGALEANRDLVEWMRAYNRDPGHAVKLSFYGFDIPGGTVGIASPRHVLDFVLDYLAKADSGKTDERRRKIHAVMADDAAWENPAVYMDPSKSIALSSDAVALRAATEDLIAELRSRRPELVASFGEASYREALQYAEIARQLLNFHAAMGSRRPGQSPAVVLGTRDALMADNLIYIVHREQERGKVLVFAHNSHLQRGEAVWPGQKYWGTEDDCRWWPAGAHLGGLLGRRYAVIGSAVGTSLDNGIGTPETGTLEARLSALGKSGVFLPTRGADFRAVPTRSGSVKNPTYVPLNAQAAQHFDWLAFLAEAAYNRGGPPLQTWEAKPEEKEPSENL